MPEAIPYEKAKVMFLVEALENKERLKEIVLDTCQDLPIKK